MSRGGWAPFSPPLPLVTVHDKESQRMRQKGGVLFSWVSLDLTVLPALWKEHHTTLWFTMLPVLTHTMCLKPRHLLMASYLRQKRPSFSRGANRSRNVCGCQGEYH